MPDLTTAAAAEMLIECRQNKDSGLTYQLWLLAFVSLSVLMILLCLLCYYPPFQDYGDWVYQGFIIKTLLTGAKSIAALKSWPVPNAASQIFLAALNFIAGPIAAARVFALAYLLCSAVIVSLAAKRFTPVDWPKTAFLLLTVICINSPLWTGEINYQLGLMLLLLYLFKYGGNRSPDWKVDAVFALSLFFCHALCLGIFAAYVGFRRLQKQEWIPAILSGIPVAACVLWYLWADPRADRLTLYPTLPSIADRIAYELYFVAKTGPYRNFMVSGIGDFERVKPLYLIGCAVNVSFAIAMLAKLFSWMIRSAKLRTLSPELLTASLCLMIAIINPAKTLGLGDVGERLLLPAMMFALLFSSKGGRVGELVRGAGAMFVFVVLLNALFILPHAPVLTSGIADANINNKQSRLRILFWEKPFEFALQVQQAQRSSESGSMPTARLSFETSVLMRNEAGKRLEQPAKP